VTDNGWRVAAELVDPLPREVHTYFAETPRARLKGNVKWAVRAGAAALPALGERLITLHFAVLALPPRAPH
jgi:hypothetical protein